MKEKEYCEVSALAKLRCAREALSAFVGYLPDDEEEMRRTAVVQVIDIIARLEQRIVVESEDE